MKKYFSKSILIIALFTIIFFPLQAQLITHDPLSYLTAIDNLYAQYDNVMNTWTSIQNQIMQIQQAVEKAKNIDWSQYAIEWDGDFDFRNEIFRAGSNLNSLMNKSREVASAVTKPTIVLGDQRYSIQDLCDYSGNKNLNLAIKNGHDYIVNNLGSSLTAITQGLSEEERRWIAKKYGISAENFVVLQQTTDFLHDSIKKALGSVEEEVIEAKAISQDERVKQIVNIVMSTKDSNGNVTEGAMMEGLVQMLDIMLERWEALGCSIDEATALSAKSKLYDMQKEQMEKEAEIERFEKMEIDRTSQPYYFYQY